MKDAMIDMMVMMMPYMKPFMWFSVAVAVIGLVFVIAKVILKKDSNKAIIWSGRVVLTASIFFLAAQAAGLFLSMPPTVNFGDSSKFEFILVSFWQIGVAFMLAGLFIKFVGAPNKSQKA